MSEIKCVSCGKKLAEASLQKGYVEIKCKCGTLNRIEASGEARPPRDHYTARLIREMERKDYAVS